jgi:hypothetical protein
MTHPPTSSTTIEDMVPGPSAFHPSDASYSSYSYSWHRAKEREQGRHHRAFGEPAQEVDFESCLVTCRYCLVRSVHSSPASLDGEFMKQVND